MDAAFFDIDNTLTYRNPDTGWGNTVSPAVAAAIRAFCAAGNVALISTGRAPQGVPESLEALPFSGMVGFDGALALLEGKRVFARFIARDDLAQALGEVQRTGIGLLFSGLGGRAFAGNPRDFSWHAQKVEDMEGLEQAIPGLEVGKLAFRYYDLPVYRKSALLRERFTCYQSAPDYFELVAPGVGKDVAARALLSALASQGMPADRVFAFGDSANDVPLLCCADIPIAMGNATEEAKSVAAYVTDDVAHDGVALALAHFGYL